MGSIILCLISIAFQIHYPLCHFMTELKPEFCTGTQVGGFHILIKFHEEPLGIIKLDASSREAGQDSGKNITAMRI
jgi:hypothetical protein